MTEARQRKILRWSVFSASTAALSIVVALSAVSFARKFYLERAQLKLTPTFADLFSRANAELGPPVKPRVVMFGDSRIAQWQEHLSPTGFELIWRGVPGETTAQMMYRYEADALRVGASAVVIQAGINDLVVGSALERTNDAAQASFRHLQSMVKLSARADVDVILLTVIPPASPPPWRRIVWSSDIYDTTVRLNVRLRTLAGERVQILDAATLLCGSETRLPSAFARDTLHLLPSAYTILNAELAKRIQVLGHAVQ